MLQPTIAPSQCVRRLPTPSALPPLARALSTTPAPARQKPSFLTVPADRLPTYPYGPFYTYKQRNAGLYGGAKIRFGNVVAAKYKNKSRTAWLPNRHTKRLWSPALGAFIRTRLTASVLHTIDLLGGIDEYLLGSKAKRIKELGPAGWALRWKIMQTDVVRARFAAQRAALGLPPKGEPATAVVHADGGGGGAAESAAAAAASESAFPPELAAQGLDSAAVLDEVDAMLERGDEFVLGDPAAEAEDVAAVGQRG
ncbi:putative 54S ribosomal protein L24 [Rosellinia necatrix]|uniref:Putative 54S ribosomal protein L24 n=1 Tax=Rosellinia necatrix TaxID=77044 RepID=A0A1W2TW41_ROSNE|nr:putative 54S ribosomal protein L24 [Rosellinia necatrix]